MTKAGRFDHCSLTASTATSHSMALATALPMLRWGRGETLMSTMPNAKEKSDALEILSREVENSKKHHKPTSRHRLAELIVTETGMPFRDALEVTEAYCDRNAPAIPEYLMGEFAIFWLKVIAIIEAIGGLVVFYYSTVAWRTHAPMWPWLCFGTLLCGTSAFMWVKSLESEADRRTRDDD